MVSYSNNYLESLTYMSMFIDGAAFKSGCHTDNGIEITIKDTVLFWMYLKISICAHSNNVRLLM